MAPAASGAPAQGSQANYKNLLTGTLARGVAFGLLALAVTPFILTAPAHATDDNTVSIAVDQNAALKPAGNLYKATTNVTVKTGKPYGFNLTMQADTADLVNAKDLTHKISATPSSTPVTLNANQWGYSLNKTATTFSAVSAGAQATPAVVADVTKAKPAGCANPANCTKQVIFAANVDPAKLASGSYSTAITYTATAKPKPFDWSQRTAKTDPSEVCRSGDNSSSCLVDLDKNMIPVKYTGTITNAQWTSIANQEDEDAKGNWYDYGKKQWANAVTVKKEALSKYQGKDSVVDQADILGFWVYIPRYTYEVMRRDGTDKPVKEQNFDIKFENINTPKKRPLACKTGNGKDYRTECNVSRELPLAGGEVSTWTTHPAFSFGKKELNGFWFGKFEATGDVDHPTVLPNKAAIWISNIATGIENIGYSYASARSLGVNDPKNVGGDDVVLPQNSNHLIKFNSRMARNSDWGATIYLSASRFGAGYNGVRANNQSSYQGGVSGCGPKSNIKIYNSDKYGYDDTGMIDTQSACSSSDLQRAYNGKLGQLASTTNNTTGIYDMAGARIESVAAYYNGNVDEYGLSNFNNMAYAPYVDIYNFKELNDCTFETCGGHAMHETDNSKKGNSNEYSQWNNGYTDFYFEMDPWIARKRHEYNYESTLFDVGSDAGRSGLTFRIILGSFAQ